MVKAWRRQDILYITDKKLTFNWKILAKKGMDIFSRKKFKEK